MKYFNFLALLLISFSLLFTSCEKENIEDVIDVKIEVEDRTENKLITRSNSTGDEGILLGCITIPYPFSMITINENQVEITSEVDFIEVIEDTLDYVVDFVYPLLTVSEEGEIISVENVDELGEIFASCVPDQGWSDGDFPAFHIDETYCVSLVYPFNVIDIEENIITVESEESFINLLAEYEIIFFEFPLTVLSNETGEIIQINSEAEFFDALLNCSEQNPPGDTVVWGGEISCFEIVFPVTVILEDGTEVLVENENDLSVVQLEHNVVGFGYPMTVINVETGEEFTVSNENQLYALIIACIDEFEITFFLDDIYAQNGSCYDLVFPITVVTSLTDEVVVESADEIEEYIGQNFAIKAPFSIELPDGTILEVSSNTLFEFLTVFENC